MSSGRRMFTIDVLRALAVLLVMGRHARGFAGHHVLESWHQGGWVGVDLFFVLSGFLVSGLLFREYDRFQSVDAKRFLIRRGLKIYPSFYLFLAVTLIAQALVGHSRGLQNILGEMFYLQNYLGAVARHTWSLAVEEHFYFGLALVFLALARKRRLELIPLIAIGALVGCLALRVISAKAWEFSGNTHIYPTHLRLDSLMFGVLIAYWYHRRGGNQIKLSKAVTLGVTALGLLLLLPPFLSPLGSTHFTYTVGLSVNYLGSGLLLVAALQLEPLIRSGDPGRMVRMGAYIGKHSYSIYLWHLSCQGIASRIQARLGLPWTVYWSIYFGGSILAGIVLAKLVEIPVLKLRDRIFPSRCNPLRST